MDEYFETFGGVRDYLGGIVDEARRSGFTETILGRRRYLPDLTSDNRQRREMAERMALNAPIQGSAADIIKVAMLRVDAAMKEAGMGSRMLLQVHDELVFEVAPGEARGARAPRPHGDGGCRRPDRAARRLGRHRPRAGTTPRTERRSAGRVVLEVRSGASRNRLTTSRATSSSESRATTTSRSADSDVAVAPTEHQGCQRRPDQVDRSSALPAPARRRPGAGASRAACRGRRTPRASRRSRAYCPPPTKTRARSEQEPGAGRGQEPRSAQAVRLRRSAVARSPAVPSTGRRARPRTAGGRAPPWSG